MNIFHGEDYTGDDEDQGDMSNAMLSSEYDPDKAIRDLVTLNQLSQQVQILYHQRLHAFTLAMLNDEALLRNEAEEVIRQCLPRTARQINFATIELPSLLEQEPSGISALVQAWIQQHIPEAEARLTPLVLLKANLREFLMMILWQVAEQYHSSPK